MSNPNPPEVPDDPDGTKPAESVGSGEQPAPGQQPQPPQYAPPQQPQYSPPPQYTQGQLQQYYGQQQYSHQQPQYAPPQYPPPAAPATGQPSYGPTAYEQNQYAQSQQPQYTYEQPRYPGAHWLPGPGEPFDGAIHDGELNRPLYGATMAQAFTRFFKNYANFTGRASRSEYWWLRLWLVLAYIAYLIVSVIISSMIFSAGPDRSNDIDGITGVFGVILFLAALSLIVPWLALHWRRLHDANLAGPLFLLSLIPLVGNLIVFVFTLLSPKPEGRRFDSPYR